MCGEVDLFQFMYCMAFDDFIVVFSNERARAVYGRISMTESPMQDPYANTCNLLST